MNAVLYDIALTAYIAATASYLAFLATRRETCWRAGMLILQAGWVCHTVALVVRWVELRRAPLLTLPEAVSVVIWAAVLLELWAERQYRMKTLGAFVLPVVVMMGLALPTGLRDLALVPRIRSAWIWVHVILALLGLGALVLNFGGRRHVRAPGAAAQGAAPGRRVLPAAVARGARPPHLPGAGARLPVPHRGAPARLPLAERPMPPSASARTR